MNDALLLPKEALLASLRRVSSATRAGSALGVGCLALSLAMPATAQVVPPGSWSGTPVSTSFVDLTGDGMLDRLLFGPDGSLAVAVHMGGRQYREIEQQLPRVSVQSVLVSDLDGDASLDLYLVSPAGNVVLTGDGTGYFREDTARIGLADDGPGLFAERLDVDADGHWDLLLHNATGDVVFWARADGTFDRDEATPAAAATDRAWPGPGPGPTTTVNGDDGGVDGFAGIAAPLSAPGTPSAAATPAGGPTLGLDLRVSGASGASLGRGPAPPVAIPSFLLNVLDDRYVNDDTLEVEGGTDIVDETVTGADIADGSLAGADVSTLTGDVTHLGGFVGLGTSNPIADLHIVGSLDGRLVVGSSSSSPASELLLGSDALGNDGVKLRFTGAQDRLEFIGTGGQGSTFGPHMSIDRVNGLVGIHTTSPGAALGIKVTPVSNLILRGLDAQGTPVFTVFEDGRTGVGTNAPNAGLGVQESAWTTTIIRAMDLAGDTVFRVFNDGRTGVGTDLPNAALGIQEVPSSPTLVRAMDSTGATVMTVTNTGRVVCAALQITGGGDLVEPFESVEHCEPGSVVVLDVDAPGKVKLSRERYDRRVAGVVSGAGDVRPGLVLSQRGVLEGDTQVALAGRVFVKASAQNGPIQVGDLLVSAELQGHAMRASDTGRSFGAVIGKALMPLESGEGLVLVLVNLQ